jgi:monoamine oxidase
VKSLAAEINLEEPWKSPNAEILDKMSLGDWANSVRNFWMQSTVDFFRWIVEAVYTYDIKEISLLWFLWTLQGGKQNGSLIFR